MKEKNLFSFSVISLTKSRIPRDAHPKMFCQQLKGLNKKQVGFSCLFFFLVKKFDYPKTVVNLGKYNKQLQTPKKCSILKGKV